MKIAPAAWLSTFVLAAAIGVAACLNAPANSGGSSGGSSTIASSGVGSGRSSTSQSGSSASQTASSMAASSSRSSGSSSGSSTTSGGQTSGGSTGGGSTGSGCLLTVSPPALDFGNVTVGVAVQKSVVVTNGGSSPCSISGLSLAPGSDPAFSLATAGLTSFSLGAGQSLVIGVSCDVISGGPPLLRNGTLVFQPNGDVPLSAYLAGTGPYADGWPKWHNDNTDQGQSAADTSADVGNLVWKFSVGVPQSAGGTVGAINPNPTYMNSPVVDGAGNVYQLGMSGTFYAVDPAGTQLWTANLLSPNPDEHPATPTLAADGTIYVEAGSDGASSSSAGQLYHLAADGGAILFQAGPPTGTRTANGQTAGADGFDAIPTLGDDGLLFDGDDNGETVTYNLVSGGSFTQANEIILQFFGERVAVALDQNDNSYWCSLSSCFGVTSPAAGFGLMPGWTTQTAANYMGANIGNAPSGVSWVNSDLAYDENHTGWLMVEAGVQAGSTGYTEVVAMDPSDGSLHWDVTLPSGPTPGTWNLQTFVGSFSSDVGNSAPAIATFPGQPNDGNVYVGNVDGLYALDGQTGTQVWKYTPSQDTGANADVDSAPAIGGDGTIFFGTAGGTFYAVSSNGQERYHYTTGGRISSSPAIGPDGTIFFVSDDGFLYALR